MDVQSEDRSATEREGAKSELERSPATASGSTADAAVRRMLGPDATRVAAAFYAAFAKRDADAMRRCYAHDVRFHDPLFGSLSGADQVMLMWTSIMPKADPFQISPAVGATTRRADGTWEVRVRWDAHYGLGKRIIDNHSDTTLVIRDGEIVEQRDEWNLAAWTSQALPAHLGGHAAVDGLVGLAAHSYIEVLSLIRRLHATKEP